MALVERETSLEYFDKKGISFLTMLETLEKYLNISLSGEVIAYELDPGMIALDIEYIRHAVTFFKSAAIALSLELKHFEKIMFQQDSFERALKTFKNFFVAEEDAIKLALAKKLLEFSKRLEGDLVNKSNSKHFLSQEELARLLEFVRGAQKIAA